ncbi:MAG: hypothetical protein NXI19_17330 [Alphaproteobacteria bacterium]|nr:hypothetical protein [Alphaproteobacteria bacterium]
MSGEWGYLVLVEGGLIFGGVLAFGLWELHKLKKLREEREARERQADDRDSGD